MERKVYDRDGERYEDRGRGGGVLKGTQAIAVRPEPFVRPGGRKVGRVGPPDQGLRRRWR